MFVGMTGHSRRRLERVRHRAERRSGWTECVFQTTGDCGKDKPRQFWWVCCSRLVGRKCVITFVWSKREVWIQLHLICYWGSTCPTFPIFLLFVFYLLLSVRHAHFSGDLSSSGHKCPRRDISTAGFTRWPLCLVGLMWSTWMWGLTPDPWLSPTFTWTPRWNSMCQAHDLLISLTNHPAVGVVAHTSTKGSVAPTTSALRL